MTVTLEKPTSAWLANELDGNHRPSRENVVVAASQTLVDGSVISLNSNGQAQIYGGAENEVAAGIFVGDAVTTGAGETGAGVYVARNAKVVSENLTFKSGLASAKKTAALADLAKLHITTVRSA
ncbi:head decoration protein [Acinetobacter thermotolerans]|uniref:head decoration protein n=1 Tax=Acinetobacter thermotolerans TaxID=3151487 RepID=UPI00325A7C38